MTEHAALHPPSSSAAEHFKADALAAIAELGDLAGKEVPAAATMHFGAWLDWPTWLRDGTSLSGSGPLPPRLTAADDLLIIANVLDREGPERILRQSLQDVRYPVGPLTALALANAPTLADALEAFARLVGVQRDYFAAELLHNDETTILHLRPRLPPSDLSDFVAMFILTLAYRLVASYSFSLERPVSLRCTLPRSKCSSDIWDDFACRVVPGDLVNSIEISPELSKLVNSLADSRLWEMSLAHISHKERQREHASPVVAIRSRVAEALTAENRAPRLKEFGGTEISERTIARQLAAHGTSFHTIVDEERRLRASILINDPSLSLAQVAERLGFADLSSFGRSFRNWFGMSPGKFRSRDIDAPPC
ncbi:DNA-binding domain-containing protein, AraC-type [Sphingomonas jaspsi DSM 18422]|uniref:DNA-binding domain-containing protein, AraC-type n=1 Tax=Sphingomonas jaspsi DSM 18422 TaxID=1123268 RepID=A0A010ZWI9_9SPHN|nr:helix-turn-helix transcriptional regulator [Sphingomonas jaspsi]EXG83034.1 DNA-binding domain-containing protein, AraC-type [Sphingomonas jaspsi DSM 18422]